ncbi:hypothetical protein CTI12_AA285580 [Artemisia annua]|uniref:Uncharacterized protein n=1 Tax=Artemisia annua TaxID=35608 RepID=A0A2U1NBP2_ARTAN|nr:hypothetical protein CTI12_AA285580 [Artemisia annua]
MPRVIESLRYEREERLNSAHGAQSKIITIQGKIEMMDGQIAGNEMLMEERQIDIKKQSGVTKGYELLHQQNEEAIDFQEEVLARLRILDEKFVYADVHEMHSEVKGILDEYEEKVAPYLEVLTLFLSLLFVRDNSL